MKKGYYDKTEQKLKEAFSRCELNMKDNTIIHLHKRQIEDLLHLWKNEAPKIWKVDSDANVAADVTEDKNGK